MGELTCDGDTNQFIDADKFAGTLLTIRQCGFLSCTYRSGLRAGGA
jgi:hypothetical protein